MKASRTCTCHWIQEVGGCPLPSRLVHYSMTLLVLMPETSHEWIQRNTRVYLHWRWCAYVCVCDNTLLSLSPSFITVGRQAGIGSSSISPKTLTKEAITNMFTTLYSNGLKSGNNIKIDRRQHKEEEEEDRSPYILA